MKRGILALAVLLTAAGLEAQDEEPAFFVDTVELPPEPPPEPIRGAGPRLVRYTMIPVDWTDAPVGVSPEKALSGCEKSAGEWLRMSGGLIVITCRAVPTVNMNRPRPTGPCSWRGWTGPAVAAANLAFGETPVFVTRRIPGCIGDANAELGSTSRPGWEWLTVVGLKTHEDGHSLGLPHAGQYQCGSRPFDPTPGACAFAPYGDFEVMGRGALVLSAANLRTLGLEIPFPFLTVNRAGGRYQYWVEDRRPDLGKVLVRITGGVPTGQNQMLAAALDPGREFADLYGGIRAKGDATIEEFTPLPSPTRTPTRRPTSTPTSTAQGPAAPTVTQTPTPAPIASPTATAPAPTVTSTATVTPSPSRTPTPSRTRTPTPKRPSKGGCGHRSGALLAILAAVPVILRRRRS